MSGEWGMLARMFNAQCSSQKEKWVPYDTHIPSFDYSAGATQAAWLEPLMTNTRSPFAVSSFIAATNC